MAVPTEAARQQAGNEAGGYYLTVSSLTQKVEASTQTASGEKSVSGFDAPVPWLATVGAILLFFVLFACALGIQIAGRIRDAKHMMTALFVSLCFASIPFVINSLQGGTHFQSRAGPDEVPKEIHVSPVSDTSVLITWKTDAVKVGSVRYGKAPFSQEKSILTVGDEGQAVKVHTVRLSRLTPRSRYEFEILSGDTWYNDNGIALTFSLR